MMLSINPERHPITNCKRRANSVNLLSIVRILEPVRTLTLQFECDTDRQTDRQIDRQTAREKKHNQLSCSLFREERQINSDK